MSASIEIPLSAIVRHDTPLSLDCAIDKLLDSGDVGYEDDTMNFTGRSVYRPANAKDERGALPETPAERLASTDTEGAPNV